MDEKKTPKPKREKKEPTSDWERFKRLVSKIERAEAAIVKKQDALKADKADASELLKKLQIKL